MEIVDWKPHYKYVIDHMFKEADAKDQEKANLI